MPAEEKQQEKNESKHKVVKEVVITRVVPRGVMPMNGFADFLREYGVVGLAVGFIFGAQVKTVVDQLTGSFINPLVGILLPGGGTLSQKTSMIHFNGKVSVFAWGAFLNTLISFVIVAALVYFIVKAFKLDKLKEVKK